MSKTRIAGVVAAVVLMSAGAASAAQSAFPPSPNEATPFSFSYEPMGQVLSGAIRQAHPASPSEATAFSGPSSQRSTMAERLSRTYSSAFPTSARETGPL